MIAHWRSDPSEGLDSKEVARRQEEYGLNEMRPRRRKSRKQIFFGQFQDFMVLILLGAALLSSFLGEYIDAGTIMLIVLLNAVLGFVQEYRAEASLEALRKLAVPQATVLRNGMVQQVPARFLVPGDILVLETGQRVAADARLIKSHFLEVEEAALTGESLPTRKNATFLTPSNSALGDRSNMIFSGTTVRRGRGKAIVCATGMRTEVGQIADLLNEIEPEKTPLAKRLEHLGRRLVWACLGICFVVVVTGVWRGEPLLLMCLAGISLAVAAIPEGLPAIVTVALALGVQRMIRRNAIVRKLAAVETLGCVTVICSDKTGTLTQNVMTVQKIFTEEGEFSVTGQGYDIRGEFQTGGENIAPQKNAGLRLCLEIGVLCNNSEVVHHKVTIHGLWRKEPKDFQVEGDPTEGALVAVGAKAGIWRSDLEKKAERVSEIPFEPQRRRMSVLYKQTGKKEQFLYVKGAPDTVIPLCDRFYQNGRECLLTPTERSRIEAQYEAMTNQALRVLALAYRLVSADVCAENVDEALEQELVFVGLVGMIDPPRESVKESLNLCQQAGIRTVMITGDHPNTAVAIARELALLKKDHGTVIIGTELDRLSDKELAHRVNDVVVFARVSPGHKLRIVRALKSRGHIVAMTGDGVNDAPAIKEADIGISMGISGSDVAKEAAAMILTDDHFSTIVAAVAEGRGIYDNIRKFIRYLLACNTGEVLTMFLAACLALPLPLLPVQILWVNLVTDGLPALALGVDRKDPAIMLRPPRFPRESLFSRGLSRKIIARGLQIGCSTIAVFFFTYTVQNDLALARTMALTTLVFCQLFHVFDCRSEFFSILDIGFFSNWQLLLAVTGSVSMHLAVLYLPVLSSLFSLVPLHLGDWAVILCLSGWTLFVSLIRRLWRPKRAIPSAAQRV